MTKFDHVTKILQRQNLGYWANCHREILHDMGKILNFTITEFTFHSDYGNKTLDVSFTSDVDVGIPPVVIHADFYERNIFGPTFTFM